METIMSSTKIHISAPHEFHEDNRAARGDLKKRAKRVLAARCKDEAFSSFEEVSNPAVAHQCFRILKTDGQWKIGKVKL